MREVHVTNVAVVLECFRPYPQTYSQWVGGVGSSANAFKKHPNSTINMYAWGVVIANLFPMATPKQHLASRKRHQILNEFFFAIGSTLSANPNSEASSTPSNRKSNSGWAGLLNGIENCTIPIWAGQVPLKQNLNWKARWMTGFTPLSPSQSQASALPFAPWTCVCKWTIVNRKKSRASTILAAPYSTFSTPSNTRSNCMRSPRKSHQSIEVHKLHTWRRNQGLPGELRFTLEQVKVGVINPAARRPVSTLKSSGKFMCLKVRCP